MRAFKDSANRAAFKNLTAIHLMASMIGEADPRLSMTALGPPPLAVAKAIIDKTSRSPISPP